MKILLILGVLAFGSVSYAASVTDGRGLVTSTASAPEAPVASSSETGDLSTGPELSPVTAEGILNSSEMHVTTKLQAAASVPESAWAAFLALFGYILMLRRRSA